MTVRQGLLVALLLAVAGCGGNPPAARERATATPTAAAERCGDAQPISFRTSDGLTLAGAVAGSGPVGVC